MKSASTTTQGEPLISSGKCSCGNVSQVFVASAENQYRLVNAPLSTLKVGLQGEEMIALSTRTDSQSTQYATLGATRTKGLGIFNRIFLAASILILASASSAFAQVGAAISGQWVTTSGTPAANARLTVCPYTASGIPCYPQATIYADPGLTVPLSQPYATNSYGNATVYVATGAYIVQVAINGTITYSYGWTASTGSGSISGTGAPTGLTCNANNAGQIYVNKVTGEIYTCNGAAWTLPPAAGGPYLPLAGGTLAGPLNGTSATFSGTVVAPTTNGIHYSGEYAGNDWVSKLQACLLSNTTGTCTVDGSNGFSQTGTTVLTTSGLGQSIQFIQSGIYTVLKGIILTGGDTVIGMSPSYGHNPVSIEAANNAAINTPLITVGSGVVIAWIDIDGNTCGVGWGLCHTNNGMSGANPVVSISGGGNQRLTSIGIWNGTDAGIISTGVNNLYLENVLVAGNSKQGYLCSGSGDIWIQGGSQFEANGYSGIELAGCGSVRMTGGDISVTGSLGAGATSTKCSLYVHGLSGSQLATTNIFDSVQFGSAGSSAICDVNNSTNPSIPFNLQNIYQGIQSISPSSSYPNIYVYNGQNDFFSGTVYSYGSQYGIQFSESGSGFALPSSVRLVFANGTTLSNAWNDTTVYKNDFSGSIVGNTQTYFSEGPFEQCTKTSNGLDSCTETFNEAFSNSNPVKSIYMPNLNGGGYQNYESIGVNSAPYNSTALGFTYSSSGSTSNKAFWGVAGGVNAAFIDGLGNVTNLNSVTSGHVTIGTGSSLNIYSGNYASGSQFGPTIRSSAGNNLILNSYGGTSSVFLNNDNGSGTGGTNFGNGAGTIVAVIDGSGNISGNTATVSSARRGTFTCTAGGNILISNTNFITGSDVLVTMETSGGTPAQPYMNTPSSGASFKEQCGASDTSVYRYTIWN